MRSLFLALAAITAIPMAAEASPAKLGWRYETDMRAILPDGAMRIRRPCDKALRRLPLVRQTAKEFPIYGMWDPFAVNAKPAAEAWLQDHRGRITVIMVFRRDQVYWGAPSGRWPTGRWSDIELSVPDRKVAAPLRFGQKFSRLDVPSLAVVISEPGAFTDDEFKMLMRTLTVTITRKPL